MANEISNNFTMPVQVVSDLHLEFYGSRLRNIPNDIIVPHSPETILALVGDIGHSYTNLLKEFLYLQADQFRHVIFIAGNHEYYHHCSNDENDKRRSMSEQKGWMRRICNQRSNLHFLEQDNLELNGIVFLGTTLWSKVPDNAIEAVEDKMNDYSMCHIDSNKLIKVSDTNSFFQKSYNWLIHQVAKHKHKPIVILTHHAPSTTGTSDPKYELPGNLLRHAFATDVIDSDIFTSSNIQAWACGHTHYNFDFETEGGIRLVSNQNGYPNELIEDGSSRGQEKASTYQPDGVILHIAVPPEETLKI